MWMCAIKFTPPLLVTGSRKSFNFLITFMQPAQPPIAESTAGSSTVPASTPVIAQSSWDRPGPPPLSASASGSASTASAYHSNTNQNQNHTRARHDSTGVDRRPPDLRTPASALDRPLGARNSLASRNSVSSSQNAAAPVPPSAGPAQAHGQAPAAAAAATGPPPSLRDRIAPLGAPAAPATQNEMMSTQNQGHGQAQAQGPAAAASSAAAQPLDSSAPPPTSASSTTGTGAIAPLATPTTANPRSLEERLSTPAPLTAGNGTVRFDDRLPAPPSSASSNSLPPRDRDRYERDPRDARDPRSDRYPAERDRVPSASDDRYASSTADRDRYPPERGPICACGFWRPLCAVQRGPSTAAPLCG
ncbi:hypothetical protein C8R43DRAFT_50888 [Mycena crocata]|nr:hypothetical protein C8R43DRAFT_50888 [Mycena crocata]